MAIFNFIKQPKIRQFHHDYIYYDPKKEERENRIKRIQKKKEAQAKGELYADNLRGAFHSQLKSNAIKRKGNNTKLYITLFIIIALIYWLK